MIQRQHINTYTNVYTAYASPAGRASREGLAELDGIRSALWETLENFLVVGLRE